SYSYWHKDTYMPLGRTRYHVPRCVFLFYFPQDTSVQMGPTRVIPGSQYQDHITEADHAFAYVPDRIRAGNCLLTAYDIAHAGMSNLTDQTRYMVKFNILRTRNPLKPSWNGGEEHWQPPAEHLCRFEHPQTWSYVWDWMRGHRCTGAELGKDIDRHLSHLNGGDQQERLAAIYALGAMGEPALGPLLSSLLAVAGQDRIEPPYIQKEDGSFEGRGDPLERRWTEGGYIFQDEAHALGCLGDIAVDPLIELLDREDPWIVINAAFALGEIGASAARAVPRLAALLDGPDHRVVRAVLEGIACIGKNTIAALPTIRKLLQTKRDVWEQDTKLDYLVGDQVHFNSLYALLLSDLPIDEMEELLIDRLEAPASNVCVPAMALEILLRLGSPMGLRRALAYLQAHRWDDSGDPPADVAKSA
ncbi:MAG: HEAT repeat domain-containing protein, partial [Woeseiaceae bacterium]